MSSRDVIARDRAMVATLTRWGSSINQVSRRTRWPGSTQTASSAGPVTPTTQIPLGVISWQTLLSLPLDPGSWLIVGGAIILPTAVSGVVRESGIRVAGQTVTKESNVTNSFFSLDFNLVTHAVVRYGPAGGTALLEIFDQASSNPFPPVPPTATVEDHFLLAYPL